MKLTILAMLLFTGSVFAQVQTPTVFLNEKIRSAQLAVGQRANLRYDLRSIGGQHLAVKLFHHSQSFNDTPVRQWVLHKANGTERLDFKGLPRAVYTIVAVASDEQGLPLAAPAQYISVEYGGWRGWEAFKPPVEEATTPPAAFNDVDVTTNTANRNMQIAIDPSAVVLRPGGELPLKAGFAEMQPERLTWKLSGPGELKAVDEYHYIYKAPPELLGSKLVRIEVQSVAHPDLTASSMVLVTNADPDSLNTSDQ